MSARPKLAAPQMESALSISSDLLREILAELKGLRSDLALHPAVLQRVVKVSHAKHLEAELVAAIARFAGARRFSTWALLDHCTLPDSGELRDAIRAAVGSENGKKLGRLLKRLEGVDLDGLRVIRDGDEGGTARWRVSETP